MSTPSSVTLPRKPSGEENAYHSGIPRSDLSICHLHYINTHCPQENDARLGEDPRNAMILTHRVITRVLTQAGVILLGTMCVYVMEMTDGQVTARDTTMVCILLSRRFPRRSN